MRENRPSGSAGGAGFNLPLPRFVARGNAPCPNRPKTLRPEKGKPLLSGSAQEEGAMPGAGNLVCPGRAKNVFGGLDRGVLPLATMVKAFGLGCRRLGSVKL